MSELQTKQWKSKVEDVDEKGIVTVYANAFNNKDADGDISVKGSFTKTINESFDRVKWFYNHDNKILLGVPIEAIQDDYGLKVRGQINLKKQIGRDVFEDYKLYAEHGRSLEHSVAVRAIKRDVTNKSMVLEWLWKEYSTLSSWGSNPNTPLIDIKSEKDVIDYINLLDDMLKGRYSDEKLLKIESQLAQLKSLVNDEPIEVTQHDEPIEVVGTINYKDLLNEIKKIKLKQNGRR